MKFYNAKDNLPDPAVNGYSNGVLANIIIMENSKAQFVKSHVIYDHNKNRWLDWELSKEEHKPVLAEQVDDKIIQRVLDWAYLDTDYYKMTEDFWEEE